MKLKDKLGYIPLLIVDGGYNENIYASDGMLLPMVKKENFIIRRDYNKKIIEKFIEKANNLGFIVLNVATEEYDISLQTRINRANVNFSSYNKKYENILKEKLSLYIALQYDPKACTWDDSDNHLTTYYLNSSSQSENLASLINNHLSDFMGFVKPSNNYILKNADMITVLIDASFMDLKKKLNWMRDEDFIEEVSNKILMGCLQYFGIKNIEVISSAEDAIKRDAIIKKLQQKVDNLDKRLLLCEDKITNLNKYINKKL
jgi:hypothetical protein